VKASIRPLGILFLVLALAGCNAEADDAVSSAQDFWDALAAGRIDAALDHVVPDERDRQRRILEEMAIQDARVEPLEVPPEARVALLPTRVTRQLGADSADAEPQPLATVTVLRRTGDRWLVDLAATREELQAATVAAVGERLGAAARQLGDALGELGPEIGIALERLGEALKDRVDAETRQRSGDLATDLERRLEEAGTALAESLERLEEALSSPPPEEGTEGTEGTDKEASGDGR
jgi:hypothetical protein